MARKRRRLTHAGSASTLPIELVLYVSGASHPCIRAVANARRLLSRYDASQVALTVCDLARDASQGERDQIAFTPTLCTRPPTTPMRIVGDLSRPNALIELLEFHGVFPTHGD